MRLRIDSKACATRTSSIWLTSTAEIGGLHEALNEAQALVLCAPAAVESTWVRKEVEMAIGRGIPVIPCALERCEERWHPELQWIDFTKEPDTGYKRLLAALERIPTLARTWPREVIAVSGLESLRGWCLR